jgi:hypothetical protein
MFSARIAASLAMAALGFAVGGAPASRDQTLAPEAIAPLQKIAKELAKGGRAAELDEVLSIVRALGMSGQEFERFAPACRQDCAKVRKPAPTMPSTAKAIEKVATELAALLASKSDPDRRELARWILRLDGRVAAAHAALGEELVDGAWLDATGKVRRARRVMIAKAVERVRSLDVKIDIAPSRHAELSESRCKQPLVATCGRIEFHGVWPEQKLRRVVLETMQCAALISFLATDRCEVPPLPARSYVLFDDAIEFQHAVRRGVEKKRVDPLVLDLIGSMDAAIFGQDEFVTCQTFEGHCVSVLLGDLITKVGWKTAKNAVRFDDLECWPVAGVINWTTLALVGERLPVYVIEQSKEDRARDGRTTSLTEEQRRIRERMLLLSEAGLMGGRAWMQYLASRGEDPPLVGAFRDQIGKIQGDDLLKATFVVEMLSQDGPLLPMLSRLPQTTAADAAARAFTTVTGKPLSDFEREWREWLAPPNEGIAERIVVAAADDKLPADERQTLEALNALRVRAKSSDVAVDFDVGLSSACRKHASYLAQNPDQMDRWPDAHEEYPDHAGFDAEGAWAGTHAVIAPGVKDGRDALACWMATYFHRLPLLDPNLVRIGFACEKGCAILDCGSFVRPAERIVQEGEPPPPKDPRFWAVVWPPPGMNDVPTRCGAELPPPVVGVETSTLGYPITFQLDRNYFRSRTEVDLALHLGNADGALVPCHVTTPTAPTNPQLVPQYAWCLLPTGPLRSGASYTVTGAIRVIAADVAKFDVQWSFRCGK